MPSRHAFAGIQEERYMPPLRTVIQETVSGQASVESAAPSSGNRWVAGFAVFSGVWNTSAGAYTTVEARVVNGAAGGSTYLFQCALPVTSNGIEPIVVELFAPATEDGVVTIEFNKAVTGLSQSVHLTLFEIK